MSKWRHMDISLRARRTAMRGYRDGGDQDIVSDPRLFTLAWERHSRLWVTLDPSVARGGESPSIEDRKGRLQDAKAFDRGTILLGA